MTKDLNKVIIIIIIEKLVIEAGGQFQTLGPW